MKVISILLFTVIMMSNTITTKNTAVLKATYDGYEEGIYYFSDNDESYEFMITNLEILKTYDLASEKHEGNDFNITYEIEKKTDEDDEEYEVWTISKLELIKK